MEIKLQKFEQRNTRQEDRITVTKSSSIGFPSKFYKDENIDQYKYLLLYYDPENKVIGVKFLVDSDDTNKFTLIKSGKGYGAGVSARSFFKYYNIDPLLYHGRYTYEKKDMPDIGSVYIIILKERTSKEEQVEETVEIFEQASTASGDPTTTQ